MKSLLKYLGVLGVFGALTVYADNGTPAPETPGVAGAPAAKPEVVLTPAEMASRAIVLDQQVKTDGRHVQHLQELTRKAKDVIKLTCVNDKLVEMKALQNQFESSESRYTGYTSGGDVEALRGAFGEMQTTAGSVHEISVQADGCVGTPDLYKQESNVVEHPPFPDDPTAADPFTNAYEVEPPAYASPFS